MLIIVEWVRIDINVLHYQEGCNVFGETFKFRKILITVLILFILIFLWNFYEQKDFIKFFVSVIIICVKHIVQNCKVVLFSMTKFV